MHQRFLTGFTDKLQQDGRVNVLLAVFGGDVQVRAGTASCVSTDGNHFSGFDYRPFPHQGFGQMAITDGVIAVTDNDVVARTLVG